jgi:hypothetical protein
VSACFLPFSAVVLWLAHFALCLRQLSLLKATFPRLGNWSPAGTLDLVLLVQRIANSELLTAGNPTV